MKEIPALMSNCNGRVKSYLSTGGTEKRKEVKRKSKTLRERREDREYKREEKKENHIVGKADI